MSFDLKFERAREHLQSLEAETADWLQSDTYTLTDEPDPDGIALDNLRRSPIHARRLRVSNVKPIPDRLRLIIGDCLFNLRSTLDHLALALAQSFTPGMTQEQIAASEFPIYGPKPMLQDAETRKVGCIAPPARTVIKALQPYHRGNSYPDDPLWVIHDLNRIDKHRRLSVCTAFASEGGLPHVIFDVQPDSEIDHIAYFVVTPEELILDAVVLRYGVIVGMPKSKVDMQVTLPVEIALGKAERQSLNQLSQHCEPFAITSATAS